MSASGNAYDDLPYTEHAYAESHPDRLAVVSRLSGWEGPSPTTGRVLELGCGRGGNLLPMAASLPACELVGVDRSARQIEEARRIALNTGLGNVRFVDADFVSVEELGTFDFVACHGVCSWIPPASRRELLRLVGRSLAPSGIAYLSFNVLPGWYDRLAARDWLRFWRQGDTRESLRWLREQLSPELVDTGRRLDAVARRLAETDRAYEVHEYLADDHHPQLVGDLLAEAGTAGLVYMGDAIPSETALELLPAPVVERASRLGAPDAQQLVDFVRCTAFRRTLLVRADTSEARGWAWSPTLRVEALEDLRVASRLRPPSATASPRGRETFEVADLSVDVVDDGARTALRQLGAVAPRSLPFRELAARASDASALRREIFDLWLATGAIDLHVDEPPLGDGTSRRPLACPVARWHAVRGGPITNRWHQEVCLADTALRSVLTRLDGKHTVEECARQVGGSMDVAHAAVAALAASALLIR